MSVLFSKNHTQGKWKQIIKLPGQPTTEMNDFMRRTKDAKRWTLKIKIQACQ